MTVHGEYNGPDRDAPVLCPHCTWRGKVRHSVFVPAGVAECPECGTAVELTDQPTTKEDR